MQVNKTNAGSLSLSPLPSFHVFVSTISISHLIPTAQAPPSHHPSHDQARYPGNYLALSNKATTDSNEE